MGARDVLLFLGFGLHLPVVGFFLFAATFECDSIFQDALEIVHNRKGFNR